MWWYFCSLKGAASSRDMFLLLKNTTAKIILTLVSLLSGEFIKLCSKNSLPIKFATDSKRWKIEKRKRRPTSFRNRTCSPVHSRHTAFTGNCRATCFGIVQRNSESKQVVPVTLLGYQHVSDIKHLGKEQEEFNYSMTKQRYGLIFRIHVAKVGAIFSRIFSFDVSSTDIFFLFLVVVEGSRGKVSYVNEPLWVVQSVMSTLRLIGGEFTQTKRWKWSWKLI